MWEYDETTDEYYLHLFSKKQPDLNWENPQLRREVYDLMKFWLDKGVDGFRMDVINFISKVQGLPDGAQAEHAAYGDGGPYFLNGPRIHEFLQEMNCEVLSKYDTITVGEMPGVDPDLGKLYTGSERNELNMVFHFEHVSLGDGKFGKWSPCPWKLTELKQIFSKWQEGLKEDGWNSLYWSNHDQPRAVSRFATDREEYRVIASKMLATCLHMLQGTPYIYQGEEIGMTNVHFDDIAQYRDIETLNAYRDLFETGKLSYEEMMQALHERSRDNSRTPVQWDSSAHAGFTAGTPWIDVNPNYTHINAERVLQEEDSIFHYYKRLIRLRKENEIIVYGEYDLLLADHEEIYAFTRTLGEERLLVMTNFSALEQEFILPESEAYETKELLMHNYPVDEQERIEKVVLRPYEARVYRLR